MIKIIKKLVRRLIEKAGYEVRLPLGNNYYQFDSLVTCHNHDFMKDRDFIESYSEGLSAVGGRDHKTYWRVHIALTTAAWASKFGGAFAECGVADGCTTLSIMKYLSLKNKKIPNFYLFDTFSGLNPDQVPKEEEEFWGETAIERQAGYNKSTYTHGWSLDKVVNDFRKYPSVKIFKGYVPDILHKAGPEFLQEKFSFIHIDMNNSEPEVQAMEFFKDRLTSPAVILLDDYAYYGYGYQKKAMDEWAARNGVIIASLPTGQGLIFWH